MSLTKLALNPELQMVESRSNLFKNSQSIGKIYSKLQLNIFRESSDSLNLKLNSSRIPFREQILLGAESPLAQVNRMQFQFGRSSPEHGHDLGNNNSSLLQISPVTYKSFRINKLHSSQMSSLIKNKKTPELVGKLSSSKLHQDIYSKQSQIKAIKGNKNRSPGHLTHRKHLRRGAKQQITAINSAQVSRFMQFIDQNLITSQQLSQTQLNPENQRLLRQVKQKQQYLKLMIQKRRKAGSQQPIPHKNIQQFRYNYPVSNNSQRIRNNNKTNPYLQKIEQNSKLFQGSLISPKFLTKIKEATTTPTHQIRKSSRFNDREQVLEKSKNKEMKISPQVNVSFTIKSPRRAVESEDKMTMIQTQVVNEAQEWRENLSRVSLYCPEKNINFNSKRPKFVSMLIDPSKQQLDSNPQESAEKIPDFYILAEHFSRSRKQPLTHNSQEQTSFITLKTSMSTVKQLLIESGVKSDIRFCLPSCLFDNTKISPTIDIKQLHLFIEKVYNELRIHPEIITIKRYKNAIFTGVFQSSTKDSNFYTSVIYHFSGSVYIGTWKESRSPFDMHKAQVDGCKHGIGLDIVYELSQKMEEKVSANNEQQKNENSPTPFMVDIYYGQFQNNKRQGYGVGFRAKYIQSKLLEDATEIGCWSQGQKNGWFKIYKNNMLQFNAEYEKGLKVKQLALRGQKEEQKGQDEKA